MIDEESNAWVTIVNGVKPSQEFLDIGAKLLAEEKAIQQLAITSGRSLGSRGINRAALHAHLYGCKPCLVIMDDFADLELRALAHALPVPLEMTPSDVAEPKSKKAQWKQQKSVFNRVYQGRKAKG